MRKIILASLAAASLAATAQPTLAKGHLVGAAVGATVAGKHHRVAGAVIGGAVGHHMAKKHDQKKLAGHG